MAQQSKCWRNGCDWAQDDLPHIDACIEELREHFRGAHPESYLGNLEDLGYRMEEWNRTAEFIIRQATAPNGEVLWRTIATYWEGRDVSYWQERTRPDVIAEVKRRFDEANPNGLPVPQPQHQPGGMWDVGPLPGGIFDGPEEAGDGLDNLPVQVPGQVRFR